MVALGKKADLIVMSDGEEDNWRYRQREPVILKPRYEHQREWGKRQALLVARARVQDREEEARRQELEE